MHDRGDDPGRPVAQLGTMGADDNPEGKLSRLPRDGVVRWRRVDPPPVLFISRPPRLRADMSGAGALTKERREGR